MNSKPPPPPPPPLIPKRVTEQLEIVNRQIEEKFDILEKNPHSTDVHNIVTGQIIKLLEIQKLLKGR